MKKRLALRATIGAAVLAAGSLLFTPAAQAAANCPYNYICFYQNPDYHGSASIQARLSPVNSGYVGEIDNFQNSHYTDGENLNDSVSSVLNYTDKWSILCQNADFGDPNHWYDDNCIWIPPQSKSPDLSDFGPDYYNSYHGSYFNDMASSVEMLNNA